MLAEEKLPHEQSGFRKAWKESTLRRKLLFLKSVNFIPLRYLPSLVLTVLLLLTLAMWRVAEKNNQNTYKDDFAIAITDAEQHLSHALTLYEKALSGTAVFLTYSVPLDHSKWRHHFQRVTHNSPIPGLREIGYVETKGNNFLLKSNKLNISTFYTNTPHSYLRSLDLSRHPDIRATAIHAIEHGSMLITRPFLFTPSPGAPGFSSMLLIVPVYDTFLSEAQNSKTRRQQLKGITVALIDQTLLLQSLQNTENPLLDIYLNEEKNRTPTAFSTTRTYTVFGQKWNITWAANAAFFSKHKEQPILWLIGGIALALGLSSIAFMLIHTQSHAVLLARKMTIELQESEERYHLALQGASVGLWDLNLISNTLFWSERFKTILGITEQHSLPTPAMFEDRIHPQDRERVKAAFLAHLKYHQEFDIEYRISHEKGYFMWVHMKGQAVWDHRGKATRIAGSLEDITARVLYEQQLRESRMDMLRAQTVAHVGNWKFDVRTQKLIWSPEMFRIFEIPEENKEPDYETHKKSIHPDDMPVWKYYVNKVLIDGERYSFDFRILTPTGKTKYVSAAGEGRIGPDGSIIELFGTVMDISARKETESKLAESEERFALAVEGANDGIWDWPDVAKDAQFWSPRFKELLGYKSDEIDATFSNFFNMLHPDDLESTVHAITLCIKQGGTLDIEYRMKLKNGTYNWFHAKGKITIDKNKNHKRMAGSLSDISYRKRAEETLHRFTRKLLEQQIKLETANKELENFTYIASHDLRAPLINLRGFADILERSVHTLQPALQSGLTTCTSEEKQAIQEIIDNKLPKSLRYIHSGVERIEQITDAIMQLSRTGRQEMHCKMLNITKIVERCVNTLQHQIEQHQAEVSILPMPDIKGDPTMIEQVFGNILDNAVKYLDPARPGAIEISGVEKSDVYEFSIKDNGRGIAPDDLDKVFAIFRRASNAEGVKGEGIGMAYVRAIIARHGGRIWCESLLDGGTTFHFTIAKHFSEENNGEASNAAA